MRPERTMRHTVKVFHCMLSAKPQSFTLVLHLHKHGIAVHLPSLHSCKNFDPKHGVLHVKSRRRIDWSPSFICIRLEDDSSSASSSIRHKLCMGTICWVNEGSIYHANHNPQSNSLSVAQPSKSLFGSHRWSINSYLANCQRPSLAFCQQSRSVDVCLHGLACVERKMVSLGSSASPNHLFYDFPFSTSYGLSHARGNCHAHTNSYSVSFQLYVF